MAFFRGPRPVACAGMEVPGSGKGLLKNTVKRMILASGRRNDSTQCGSNLVSPPPLSGVVWASPVLNRPCRVVSASPGVTHKLCFARSRLAAIPGASATKVSTPFHNTARASIKLHQIGSSSPAPPLHFLTKPSLPTTIHSTLPLAPTSSFSGTRTLELSFRLASSPVHLHTTHLSIPCLDI